MDKCLVHGGEECSPLRQDSSAEEHNEEAARAAEPGAHLCGCH